MDEAGSTILEPFQRTAAEHAACRQRLHEWVDWLPESLLAVTERLFLTAFQCLLTPPKMPRLPRSR